MKRTQFVAVLAVGLVFAMPLLAQLPENITSQKPRAPASIEIYRGTQKIQPEPLNLVAATEMGSRVQDATRAVVQTTNKLLVDVLDRAVPKWELPRLPVVVNITVPPAVIQQTAFAPAHSPTNVQPALYASATTSATPPGYLPWVQPTREFSTPVHSEPREEAKPTVIVIREPASVMTDRTESGAIVLSPTLLLFVAGCFAFALFGTILALIARTHWLNRRPFDPFAQNRDRPVREGHLMVAGWDAGPIPESAQKFDLGPSYAEQLAQQKIAEIDGENAMLQHILEQNLVLQSEWNSDE